MTASQFQRFTSLKACRHGQMLFNVNDMYVGRSFELYGEFSEGEAHLFQQIVQPGDLVLEIGANIGTHTLLLAQLAGVTGQIVAFEPQRLAFQLLCANIALNNVTNAWCFQQAVGPEAGQINVPILDPHHINNFGGLSLGSGLAGESVAMVTVDSLNLGRCNVIKIDVEGMEEFVLRGAVNTLAQHRPILYVENDREERSDALIRFIDSLGYNMYWHCPPLYNPANFYGNSENIFGGIVSENMLCVSRAGSYELRSFEPVLLPSSGDAKMT